MASQGDLMFLYKWNNNFFYDKKIYTSLSIFELQRRSNTQNVRNAHGYRSGLFNFRYKTSGKKSLSRAQNGGHFEKLEILITASIWPPL